MKTSSGSDAKKSETRSKSGPNTDGASTSTIIILEDAANKIITLDDTQSSLAAEYPAWPAEYPTHPRVSTSKRRSIIGSFKVFTFEHIIINYYC